MPQKSNKSDYMILAVLGVISTGVILLMIGWGMISEDSDGQPAVRTTQSTNTEGTMACYVLFERLGVQVRRFEYPPLSDNLKPIDVFFVVDPIVPIQPGEAEELTQWVHNGGVLVCTRDVTELLRLLPQTGIWTYPGHYTSHRLESTGESNSSTIPPDSAGLPLARDVRDLHLTTSSVLEIDDIEPADRLGVVEPLLSDTGGCRLCTRTVGTGRIIVLSDSSFLANGRIGKSDNAILAANLAAYSLSVARGRRVAFDEYHFGYGARRTRWTAMGGMLYETSAGWAVLIATVSGLCFLIYKGRRFGIRRESHRVRRRSKMEYINSVGATYRAAGANLLTLRLIFTWLKAKEANLVGLPESSPVKEIAKRLARRTGRNPEQYERAFHRCEKALTGKRLSRKRLAALLAELSTIESETVHGHSAGK